MVVTMQTKTPFLPLRRLRDQIEKASPLEGNQSAYEQLRPRERIFVEAYVATENPMKAIFAYDSTLEAKPNVAKVRAHDLMKRPLVQAAIAEKWRKLAERYEITAEKITQEIALVAYARMSDYVRITDQGEPFLDLNKIPEQHRDAAMAAISEVTVDDIVEGRGDDQREIRRVKFKLHSKLDALDKLMKYTGAYAAERLELSGPNGGPIQTQSQNVNVTMSAAEAAELYARKLEGND